MMPVIRREQRQEIIPWLQRSNHGFCTTDGKDTAKQLISFSPLGFLTSAQRIGNLCCWIYYPPCVSEHAANMPYLSDPSLISYSAAVFILGCSSSFLLHQLSISTVLLKFYWCVFLLPTHSISLSQTFPSISNSLSISHLPSPSSQYVSFCHQSPSFSLSAAILYLPFSRTLSPLNLPPVPPLLLSLSFLMPSFYLSYKSLTLTFEWPQEHELTATKSTSIRHPVSVILSAHIVNFRSFLFILAAFYASWFVALVIYIRWYTEQSYDTVHG